MLNRWAGVRSDAQPKERTRVEVGKESSENGDSFEVSSNATVVMGETSCIGFRAYQIIIGCIKCTPAFLIFLISNFLQDVYRETLNDALQVW